MSTPAEVLLATYGAATVERIARHHGLKGDPAAALEQLFRDKKSRKAVVDKLSPESRSLMAFIEEVGRRLRGERVKKRWFLHGYDRFEELIQPLIDQGLVVVGNVGGREAISLDVVMEQGLLQQWIQVTPGFESVAGKPPPAREVVEQVEDETKPEFVRRTLVTEYNLLQTARYIEQFPIRLNRDGSPHRSDLKGLAPWMIDRPGVGGRTEAFPDPLTQPGWEIMIFSMSLAESLGLLVRRDELLRAVPGATSWFLKPFPERLALLLRGVEQQRAWSEIDAALWAASGAPPATGEGDGGFLDEGGHGANLAGARGSVLAALRRLGPQDWFDANETIQTIAKLEHRYLSSTLPQVIGSDPPVTDFVRTVLLVSFAHLGGIELGRGSGGQLRARVTPAGRAMLQLGDPPVEPGGRGAILVEPSFEVTCFIDMASLRLLFDLSRFAELVRTSERVVRYRLTGESVQWGYARGYTADGISRILSEYSAQPVPPPVIFALSDWERVHRRVTVFLHGDVVAAAGKSDPEVVQSGVLFAMERAEDTDRVDAVHTFVVTGHRESLERSLRATNPTVIDYNGPIVPGLSWKDTDRILAPVGATDFRTLSRLQRFCVQEDDDVYRILPDRVRAAGPEGEGYEKLVQVLRDGLVGGLTAEREIQLKKIVGQPADARIESMDVLMISAADDGDRVARIHGLQPYLSERLGPRAFRVKPGSLRKLTDALRKLGIDVDTRG